MSIPVRFPAARGRKPLRRRSLLRVIGPSSRTFRISSLLFCLLVSYPSLLSAQTGDLAGQKQAVRDLFEKTNYLGARPLLEKIVAADPADAEMQFDLGIALISQGLDTPDEAQRKAVRVRARAALVKAKELGIQQPVVDAVIQSLPLDGSDGEKFSENITANSLMNAAEALFSQGKLDDAFNDYQKALEFDPKLYQAALYAGDTRVQKGDFAGGETWYQRAIAIDPNKETAYRYSATPLMKQGQTEAARDRYVEAFITEPYSQLARSGLLQWGQITGTNLAHPAITLPAVTFDAQGNVTGDFASDASGNKDEESRSWIAYAQTRSTWRKERFAKTHPNEPAYRHSLPEEAEALRSALAAAAKETKPPSSSLAKLKKLDEEGLLEAYILLALADEGLSQDYPAYLKENRDKLRRYVTEYVVTGGGK